MVYHEFPYKHSHKNVGIPHFFRHPYDSTSDQTWKNRDSMISCNISHFTQWYCQGIGRNSEIFPQKG